MMSDIYCTRLEGNCKHLTKDHNKGNELLPPAKAGGNSWRQFMNCHTLQPVDNK